MGGCHQRVQPLHISHCNLYRALWFDSIITNVNNVALSNFLSPPSPSSLSSLTSLYSLSIQYFVSL